MRDRGKKLKDIKTFFEVVSPIIVDPTLTSFTIGISKRFFLFDLMQKLSRRIEDDPHLNFISLLKYYKVLGRFLDGTIHDLYRDRKKAYVRNFFIDEQTYHAVREDIEWAYEKNPHLTLTITKWGVVLYNNYKKDSFNILLVTPHSGTLVPRIIAKKQRITDAERHRIEDTSSHRLYGDIVLQRNGIWIDTKLSRFACDYNRPSDRAIYNDFSEAWIKEFWREELSEGEREWLLEGYEEFYFTLTQLIETHRFNIIFDGHTMMDEPGRPLVSFGTEHIPKFYMPVVRSMQRKMRALGYADVGFNQPFGGGNILQWCKDRFPDIFIFSMEINKQIYMNKDQVTANAAKVEQLSKDLIHIFDIEDEEEKAAGEPAH